MKKSPQGCSALPLRLMIGGAWTGPREKFTILDLDLLYSLMNLERVAELDEDGPVCPIDTHAC